MSATIQHQSKEFSKRSASRIPPRTAEKAELSFTVLSDPAAGVARSLGVVFTPTALVGGAA